jgi:hypothetical protein
MPDPFTLVTTTITLVAQAIQGVQTIQGYVSKYNLADLTIASVTTECSAIRIALLQILEDFHRVLGACSFTFAALNQRLTSLDLQSASKHNDSTFMAKVKAVWNEDEMALLRNNIRGLSEAIVLLLTVSQA